jgi:rhodanese-related sulfurtransferase
LPKPKAFSTAEVEKFDGVVLDVRTGSEFGAGHIPNSINIGLGGQFASWAGTLLPVGAPLVIVADELEGVDEAVTRLARVGIESVKGFLGGGMYAWDQAGLESAATPQMPLDELRQRLEESDGLQIVDVRGPGEYAAGHAPRAINITLSHLARDLSRLDPKLPTAVICASGYRSSAGTSILAQNGFSQVFNVVGGTNGWINAGYEVERPGEAEHA